MSKFSSIFFFIFFLMKFQTFHQENFTSFQSNFQFFQRTSEFFQGKFLSFFLLNFLQENPNMWFTYHQINSHRKSSKKWFFICCELQTTINYFFFSIKNNFSCSFFYFSLIFIFFVWSTVQIKHEICSKCTSGQLNIFEWTED